MGGLNFKTVEATQLPKSHISIGFFQYSREATDERVLKMLQNQNDGPKTETWKVVQRKVISNNFELVMLVDKLSVKKIVEAHN